MNCIKCGTPLPDTARFCPACAAPVDASLGAESGAVQSVSQRRRRRLMFAGGAVVALGIGAAALVYFMRPSPIVPPTASAQVTRETVVKLTPAQVTGFDWSGLSPEQLEAARAALDQAIAKEEQTRPGNSQAAARADGQSAR